jgi:hypothetical protein
MVAKLNLTSVITQRTHRTTRNIVSSNRTRIGFDRLPKCPFDSFCLPRAAARIKVNAVLADLPHENFLRFPPVASEVEEHASRHDKQNEINLSQRRGGLARHHVDRQPRVGRWLSETYEVQETTILPARRHLLSHDLRSLLSRAGLRNRRLPTRPVRFGTNYRPFP